MKAYPSPIHHSPLTGWHSFYAPLVMSPSKRSRKKRFLLIAAGIVLAALTGIIFLANFFLEPALQKKLHTLIIQGSDSLYTYQLGKLNASFFGGDVAVENLRIDIDSNRYKVLEQRNALPSLTMQLTLEKGHIKGVGLISVLFGRKITIEEIMTKQANIRLSRHVNEKERVKENLPLWKAMQPSIKSISVNHIKLDGVKFLYNNADTSESVKLQFDRFDALVDHLQIDSTAAEDTSRIGFAKNIFLKFHDLKFRTADSSYKMKAEWITYSSKNKTVEIDSFKLQPTLEKEEFYKHYAVQASLYYVEFQKIRLINTHLDRFIRNDVVDADSMILQTPQLNVYIDKTQERQFKSKIGNYPHQKLRQAGAKISIKNIVVRNGTVEHTEKNDGTGKEGTFSLSALNLVIKNVTNDSTLIKQNNICTADAEGRILGNSPVKASFKFYLDSSNGRFDVSGSVKNITEKQLNPLSVPLANTAVPSLAIHEINFSISAEDFEAWADVRMRYDHLAVVLRKMDEETGEAITRKFLTRALNRYVLYPDNPGPDGVERTAQHVHFARLTTQSFFGVIWKT
ncbi:MAG TPA: hypothetical protein VEV15_03675, partial [Flavisolibacter sp.]|nr:hypothetical protein [Flavisolibacter sp.]